MTREERIEFVVKAIMDAGFMSALTALEIAKKIVNEWEADLEEARYQQAKTSGRGSSFVSIF